MPKFKLAAVVLTAVLVLSGCAQLPRSSEIQSGPDIKGGLTTDYLYYSPTGPNADDSQEQIINGFINAATGPQNDYSVAREYLTRNFSSKWNPNDNVLIQESRPELTITKESSAKLSIKAVAEIDSVGRWTSYPNGRTRVLDFKLVKEDGQWRINSAPNGTVLVKPVFDVLFKSYSLYFFDGQNKFMVPDLRWFSSRVSTGTRMVNALIKGPSTLLEGSVNNSFPAGTKLAIDAVTVENGTAVVDLNSVATKADKTQRSRMLSQLTATLNQLSNVFSVKIHIDHIPQEIALQNANLPIPSTSSAMLLDASGVRGVTLPPTKDKVSSAAQKLAATDFGFSPDGNYVAFASPRGVNLLRVTTVSSELTAIDSRGGQLAPVIDNRYQIWTQPKAAGESLQVHDVTGRLLFSSSAWSGLGEHINFGISREGSRIVMLVKTGKGNAIYVAAIKRSESGMPIGFGAPTRLNVGVGTIKSAAWSGPNSLAVLVGSSAGIDTPNDIYLGGGRTEMTGITDGVRMLAQVDASSWFVLDKNKMLYEFRGLNWIAVEAEVTAVHYLGN